MTDLIVLVNLVHAALAFLFRNDLNRVLHDDLIWLKAAIAANPVPPVARLDDFHAHAIPAALLGAFLKILEGAVLAMRLADIAVRLIALIEHDAILAVLAAAVFDLADTLRRKVLKMRRLLPIGSCVADKSVWRVGQRIARSRDSDQTGTHFWSWCGMRPALAVQGGEDCKHQRVA